MTPEAARASYRVAITDTVSLRKYTGSNTSRTHVDTVAHARVLGYTPQELITGGMVQQGDRKVIMLAEDLENAGVSAPVNGDKIVIRGRELNIQAVDDNTRRIGPTLIAYVIQARG